MIFQKPIDLVDSRLYQAEDAFDFIAQDSGDLLPQVCHEGLGPVRVLQPRLGGNRL